jgi:hypothetical protein
MFVVYQALYSTVSLKSRMFQWQFEWKGTSHLEVWSVLNKSDKPAMLYRIGNPTGTAMS